MSWFAPASELSDKTSEVLTQLAESGQSEAAGVADILNTIAENGDEQATDEHLRACAEEIISAARSFLAATKPELFDALLAYAADARPLQGRGASIQGRSGRWLQGAPLWTSFGERAFVFASVADAQRFIDDYPVELGECVAHSWS